MATEVGGIFYRVDLDTAAFHQKIPGVSSAVSKLKSDFDVAEQASKRLAFGLLGVATGAAGLIGYGAKIAGDLEASRQGFITLLGSAEKADETLALIKKDAASTPFELPGLITANQMLTSVTKDGTKSEKILMDVGKSLAAMGKGQPELDRIIVNLQQIGAVGHASMLDIKQFAFAGIPIFEMLQETTGKTGDALGDMISNGEITFDMLTKMFDEASNGSGRFAKAFENQAGTFNQLMSNMKDTINMTAADIINSTGIFEGLKSAIQSISDFMTDHKDDIVQGIKTFLEFVKDNAPIIIGFITGGLAPAFIGLALAVGKAALALNPWMLAGAAIAAIVQKIVDHIGGWNKVLEKLGGFIKWVKDNIDIIVPVLAGLVIAIGAVTAGITLYNAATAIAAAVTTTLSWPLIAVGAALVAITLAIAGFVAGIILLYQKNEWFRDFVNETWENIKTIIKNAWEEHIKPSLERLKEAWDNLVRSIQKLIKEHPALIEHLKTVAQLLGVIVMFGVAGFFAAMDAAIRGVSASLEVMNGALRIANDLLEKFLGKSGGDLADNVVKNVQRAGMTPEQRKADSASVKGGIKHSARGNFLQAGEMSWVGEEGPELFVAPFSGRVIPHGQSMQMSQNENMGNLHLHLHPEGLIVTDRKQARDASLLLMEEFNNAAAAHGWTPVGDGKVQAP